MVTITHDVNNLAMRNLFGPDVVKTDPNDKTKVLSVDYELMKFRMFDSVYKSMFKAGEVREVVLAMDDKNSWRKIYWKKYKENRKDKKKSIDLDWDEFFGVLNEFMREISTHIPFKVLQVQNAEADDIIGVLALDKPQDFYIISTDKDFLQLSSPRVKIYNPHKKQHIEHPNPELFLVEQSMIGQAKDNIFNIKTPLDWDTEAGKRKPGFGTAAFEKVLVYGWEKWLDDNNLRERYEFNRNLMDFSRVPTEIKRRIFRDYDGTVLPDPNNIYTFFEKYKWPDYMGNFTNVENRLMTLY